MFSGKTEELIRRLRRAEIAKQKIAVFKPRIDNRYSEDKIASHSSMLLGATPVESACCIYDLVPKDVNVVGIDEVQFLGPEAAAVCERLANRGIRVIVAGLDQTFEANPFPAMAVLMALAENVTKLSAVCVVCGAEASRSYRLSGSKELISIGASEAYQARCRKCYHLGSDIK